MAILTGNETLQILGQDGTGNNAATTQIVRTSHIAGSGSRSVTAQSDFASTTTLAAITGLSVALNASSTYTVEAALPVTSGSSGGVKLSLDTSNSLTLTSLSLTGKFFTAAGVAVVNTTTFQGSIGSTATVLLAELTGVLVSNVAGTLTVKAAQNASNATTTSILTNGWLRVNKIS